MDRSALRTEPSSTQPGATRSIARVESSVHVGADAQVDDSRLIIGFQHPRATDPFITFGEGWFSSRGFDWHPHRGMETVTYVVDGVLEHGDSLGHSGALTTGDVQWMTAGKGIIHRELAFRNERAHTLQLWVNLPADLKLVDTRYQDLRAGQRPVIETDGARLELISGAVHGSHGPAANQWPITAATITLEPGSTMVYPLPGADRAFFYLLAGDARIAGRTVTAGQIAWSEPVPEADTTDITLQSPQGASPTVVLTYSGTPINEPAALGGPFVMNTREEITEAFDDFRAGRFGAVPRMARL
jgi:redox-sensitive bicupin YhaK (pirin superfamily)